MLHKHTHTPLHAAHHPSAGLLLVHLMSKLLFSEGRKSFSPLAFKATLSLFTISSAVAWTSDWDSFELWIQTQEHIYMFILKTSLKCKLCANMHISYARSLKCVHFLITHMLHEQICSTWTENETGMRGNSKEWFSEISLRY